MLVIVFESTFQRGAELLQSALGTLGMIPLANGGCAVSFAGTGKMALGQPPAPSLSGFGGTQHANFVKTPIVWRTLLR